MTALAGVELESLVSEPDALTTRPPPCALPLLRFRVQFIMLSVNHSYKYIQSEIFFTCGT